LVDLGEDTHAGEHTQQPMQRIRHRTGPRTPHGTSAARRGVSAPQEEGGPFGAVLLAVHATSRHVEGLAHLKRVRLPFPRQREFACQNKGAGVKGMGVGALKTLGITCIVSTFR
jgi:hypothetical protein